LEWFRLGNLFDFQNGYAFKSDWFKDNGIRLLRNKNIGIGEIIWEDVARIPSHYKSEFERFSLNQGDLVLSLDRPIISSGLKLSFIRQKDLPALLLQRVARVKPLTNIINLHYLYYWFLSKYFLNIIDPGRSLGVPHISTTQLKKLVIALPPIDEQKRIILKLNELMVFCNHLETQIKESKENVDMLIQSILQEAFTA
jgi:Restriction endonuclease S subunits